MQERRCDKGRTQGTDSSGKMKYCTPQHSGGEKDARAAELQRMYAYIAAIRSPSSPLQQVLPMVSGKQNLNCCLPSAPLISLSSFFPSLPPSLPPPSPLLSLKHRPRCMPRTVANRQWETLSQKAMQWNGATRTERQTSTTPVTTPSPS